MVGPEQSIEDTVTCPFDPESSVVTVMRLKRKQILLKLERFLRLRTAAKGVT